MRGMSSVETGLVTDAGHLLSFVGSDTLPGNLFVKKYYNADPKKGMISCSVPATEHAVMCAGQKEDERETFRRLIVDVYPDGIVSVVSDTWDLWKVLTEIAPSLRAEIEAREGKVVFRPDSGDPIKIVCGYNCIDMKEDFDTIIEVLNKDSNIKSVKDYDTQEDYEVVHTVDDRYIRVSDRKELTLNEVKGCVQILDEQFGSTVNEKGYKELNPKIGLIYGDSITYERCDAICKQLKAKGYATNNVVFGIGSFTYQYNTRDTFSIACKATHVIVNGESFNIFKDPVTDDGTKKSACGLLRVDRIEGAHGSALVLRDKVSVEEEDGGLLEVVFENGKLVKEFNFEDIRARVQQK
jgi:nicotinamide phosphoribosyltransferase